MSRVVAFPSTKKPTKDNGDIDPTLTEEQKKVRVHEILGQLEFSVTGGQVVNKDDARELHNKKLQRQLENKSKL